MIRYIDKKAGKIRFAQLTGLAERNCSMKTYKIAVIAGDGVGPEVMAEAVKVLKETARIDGRFDFTFTDYPWGCEYYLKTGRMMPEDGMEILKDYDAILLGAVGYPGVPDHISLRGLLLEIRHGFDQYINLRPVKLLPLSGKIPKENIPGAAPGCIRTSPKKWSFRTLSFPERGARGLSAMPMNWPGKKERP